MATSLKTVYFVFPTLASLTNNVLTNLTQITIDLPDLATGAADIKSVRASVAMDDIITATGGSITTKTFGLRLGAAAYTSIANASSVGNSGENMSLFWELDYTSHFTGNWSGASMTCDFQLQINQSTGTTLGMVNVSCILAVTYEYDDTAATQVKSVLIPLDAPVGTIPTTITTYDTFPALDTYCPEASKSFKMIAVVVQANTAHAGATTDNTLTVNLGATAVTSGIYEGQLASDRMIRYVANFNSIATNTTHNFRLTSSVARMNHPQCYAIVTYTFTLSGTTKLRLWQRLPMEIASPFGGTASTDHQRATREIWIPESNPTSYRCAFFAFWGQPTSMSGLNMRLGTGSFVAYTDAAAVLAGGNCAMVRNDSAFTFARGRNSVNFDAYRTDTTDLGFGACGWWLINYEADVPTAGIGAATRTVEYLIDPCGTALAATTVTTSAKAPSIPEANYFISAIGNEITYFPNSATVATSLVLLAERLASTEGGMQWESAYLDAQQGDGETGRFFAYSQVRSLFQRWPGDTFGDRLDVETARRWRMQVGNNIGPGWFSISLWFTYHSMTWTCADSISGFTGTVTLGLHRSATGEKVLETTRVGDGAFSFTWYDNTEEMFVMANDGTNAGVSLPELAGGAFPISVGGGGGGGNTILLGGGGSFSHIGVN